MVYKLPCKKEGLRPTWVRMPLTGHPYANRLHAKESVQPLFIGCTDLLSKVSPMRADHRSAPTALMPYASGVAVGGSVAWRVYRATWRSASLGKPLRIQTERMTYDEVTAPDSLPHRMVLPDTRSLSSLWPGPVLPPGPGWPTGSAGPRCC